MRACLTQQFSTLVGTLLGALAHCWAILSVHAGEGRGMMIVFAMAQANADWLTVGSLFVRSPGGNRPAQVPRRTIFG